MFIPRKILVTTLLVAVLLGGTLLVFASDENVIHACVKQDGQVRIVSGPEDCKDQETAANWNIVGPQGPQGPQGPEGPQGSPGVSGYEVVSAVSPHDTINPKLLSVSCPTGKVLLGGGAGVQPAAGQAPPEVFIQRSFPSNNTTWSAQAGLQTGGTPRTFQLGVYAICGYVSP